MQRWAKPAPPRRPPRPDWPQRWWPTPNAELSTSSTNWASWRRPLRARGGRWAIGALLRRESLYSSHLATWRRERRTGILKGLTPLKRGPKSKRSPLEEENQKLRKDNQRLTEQLRRAEIVIDVPKKVGALLGWPLPKADPEETF